MGGQLKARTGSQRLRSDCGFGFTTIAAALSSHRLRKRKPRHLLAVDTELPRRRCRQGGLDASRRCPRVRQGRATFVWVSPSRLGDASTQGGLARVRRRRGARVPGPCAEPRKPARPPETSHFHGAHAARPQVPARRPLPWRWVGSRRPRAGGRGGRAQPGSPWAAPPGGTGVTVPSAGPASTSPTRSFTTESNGQWTPAGQHLLLALRRGSHDRQLGSCSHPPPVPRPTLTCLHRVRKVVPRGRGPGKFLQFPGAEVQPPRVGCFLQSAFQPPVQGQVEAPAAAAAGSSNPAVGSGSSVVLMVVVVVVGMMMWVQSRHREDRDERLGFASRRRHLLPGPHPHPTRSAAPAGGRHSFTPGGADGTRC